MVEGLLGADFLDKHKAVIDFVHHRLTLGSHGDNIPVLDPRQEAAKVLTVAMDSTMEVPGWSVLLVTGCLEGHCTSRRTHRARQREGYTQAHHARALPQHSPWGEGYNGCHKHQSRAHNSVPGY